MPNQMPPSTGLHHTNDTYKSLLKDYSDALDRSYMLIYIK